jgi:FKBP-type peptidyl-prolyl cis-trans isomerase
MHPTLIRCLFVCATLAAAQLAGGAVQAQSATSSNATGKSAAAPAAKPTEKKMSNTRTTESGLQIEDVVVGNGAEAVPGTRVTVHYTGWLLENGQRGKKFDSSVDRGQPFQFPLGAGRVIRGWDEGVAGMKVGGKRVLTIPAALGYGDRGAGGVIPPGATLVFEVELLGV